MFVASRGDTIIEVLLAITIFSMVSIGTMTIMNQGTNAAQRSLEITLVRQQIDAQAEALRAAQQVAAGNEGVGTAWSKIATKDSTGTYKEEACPDQTAVPPKSFIMDARSAKAFRMPENPSEPSWMEDINAITSPPYAKVEYPGGGSPKSYGMWIEREYKAGDPAISLPAIYSFTVNACWMGAGLTTPLRLETVVRLYDPSA